MISLNQFEKRKNLIFEGEQGRKQFQVNFKLFKLYSQFFHNNKGFKFQNDLVFQYPSQISIHSFDDFVKACQNEEFHITPENASDLLILSEFFQVEILKKEVDLYMKNNGLLMIFDSLFKKLQLKEANQQIILIKSISLVYEENAIGEALVQCLQNDSLRDSLIKLPLYVLSHILHFYVKNNENINSNDNNQIDVITDFLIDILLNRGSDASFLFTIIDFGEQKLEVIKKIVKNKIPIDFNSLNGFLMSVFDDVLNENKQIKKETENQLIELENEVFELKSKVILTQFGIGSIVQENIARNYNKDYVNDVDFENESNNQLGKLYYQQFLDQILMTSDFDEMKINKELKKKILLESFRLALNNQLDHKQLTKLIQSLSKLVSFKKQGNEFIFLLAHKGLLPNEFENLKKNIIYARIPFGITKVENTLFADFPQIEFVSLHENVQYLSNIISVLPNLKEITITHSAGSKTLDLLNSIYEMNGGKKCNEQFKVVSNIKFINGTIEIQNVFGPRSEFKNLVKQFILPPSVTFIEPGCFFSCGLETIQIPPKITKIPQRCFSECLNLKEIFIPESVEIIEENAFYMCKSLTEIILPNSIKVIKNNAFECSGLIKITLPSSLKIVEKYTFYNCTDLKKVVFNEELEMIELEAFYLCKSLEKVDLSKCTNLVFDENSFPNECEVIGPKK